MEWLNQVEFVIDPGGDEISCDVARFSIHEELGKPFELEVEIRASDDLNVDDAPAKKAKLTFVHLQF
jgi:hypothetical protein